MNVYVMKRRCGDNSDINKGGKPPPLQPSRPPRQCRTLRDTSTYVATSNTAAMP